MYQLQKLNHRHEEILMWLLLNPSKPQGDCARELGYTQGWVSQIISSDLFQSRILELRHEDFSVSVLSIREKLNATASLGLDRMIEKLEVEPDLERVRSSTDTALKRLGYGTRVQEVPSTSTNLTQNNTFIMGEASKNSLERARKLLQLKAEQTQPLASEDDQERDNSGQVTDRSLSIEGFAERVEAEIPAT